ncbi:recombinase family protein [Bacillus sp. MUM 13]|uniref:recombinase family protein n=1 Tax=Bacillus sp. MUM 13 TaxID=1678001 RepID=UPI0008F55F6C|nr:recombinase family protein [Bacillus sp. MUM 13]OIK10060.1 hypothetical protein BIV59_15100 [Bacillus sp. MUM 13]
MIGNNVLLYKKIAVSYVRTSGIVNPKTSIPNQIRDIKKYCERNQIFLKYTLIDEAETGRYTENRDQYNKLKKIVKNEHVDMVIVSFADRFARDSFEYILSIRELVRDGRQFIALYEGIVEECTSALELSMTAIKVELENEQRTTRLKDGRKAAVEVGRCPSTPTYGYKKDKDLKLVVVEEEAKVIQKIFSMYNSGYKITHIITELNRNPLYEGQPEMYPQRIWNYLKNKTYTGYIYSKNEIKHEDGSFHIEYIQKSKVPHEAIITEEEFNKSKIKWDKSHKRIKNSFYLCSGLMKCPCGKNITSAGDKNQYFSYVPKERREACCRFVLNEVDNKLLSFLESLKHPDQENIEDDIKNTQLEIQIQNSLKENESKFALGKITKKTFLKTIEDAQVIQSELQKEKYRIKNDLVNESYGQMINEKDFKGLKRRLKKEKFTFTVDEIGEIKILTWEVPL